jgi:hypothetical protein
MSLMETQSDEIAMPVAEQGSHRRLPYLMLALTAELCLLAYMLPRSPEFARWLQNRQAVRHQAERNRQLQELMKNDPPLGTPVTHLAPNPIAMVTPFGQERKSLAADGQPTVLLFIGACTSCEAKELMRWTQIQRETQGLRVVVISRDRIENITEFLKGKRSPLPIIADPQGVLARTFNAIWTPRVYGVDVNGRVAWIQKNNTASDQMAIAAVKRRKGGAK